MPNSAIHSDVIRSAQGSPSPSFCGKARAPTNHGRHKNFRPRIFAQLSRDLPIFSNFDSNFRRKQNPFHPSFYSIAALPRAPTAQTRAHRSARATTCTTSQTVIDPTVNSIAPHPHKPLTHRQNKRFRKRTKSRRRNRQCNSPAPAQPHEQQPRDRPHSRFHERHLFRPPVQCTRTIPRLSRSARSTPPSPHKHRTILRSIPLLIRTSLHRSTPYPMPPRSAPKHSPTRHAPCVTTQSESFGSVSRTGGNIISVFILRLVVPPFRPPNERRTISVLATNGGAAMLKHDSYIMSACKLPLKKHRPDRTQRKRFHENETHKPAAVGERNKRAARADRSALGVCDCLRGRL